MFSTTSSLLTSSASSSCLSPTAQSISLTKNNCIGISPLCSCAFSSTINATPKYLISLTRSGRNACRSNYRNSTRIRFFLASRTSSALSLTTSWTLGWACVIWWVSWQFPSVLSRRRKVSSRRSWLGIQRIFSVRTL